MLVDGKKDFVCVAFNRPTQDPINYTFPKIRQLMVRSRTKATEFSLVLVLRQLYFRFSHEAPVHRHRGISNPHLITTFNSEILSVQNVRIVERKQQARTNIFVTVG